MFQSNIKNRTIFCKDNIDILTNINSNTIDLIYLDPPFNKKKEFTAPIGSSAEGASFKDYFREEDVKDEWLLTIKEDHVELYNFLNGIKNISDNTFYLYNYCYLTYMAIRLIECHRILKGSGGIYFHCDATMSHYIKLLMDIIFGEKNFRNEIVWCYKSGGVGKKWFARKHDIILYYCKNPAEQTFNVLKEKSYGQTGGGQGGKVKYFKDQNGSYSITSMKDWWEISMLSTTHGERTGYPTQKPLALLKRIIEAGSNEGDIVLDPFCGCATTCIASELLNRKWIGIDISHMAYDLVKQRLKETVADPNDLLKKDMEISFTTTEPKRTDNGSNDGVIKKYVYVISNEKYKDEFKIGIASNVKSRLNSYQTSDPNRAYKIEFSFETHLFREIEKHIHQVFENRHEWVRAELKAIIREIESYGL